MLTVTFAFVVATALLFLFASTRALGVVGVFVLLCIDPLLFGGILRRGGAGLLPRLRREEVHRGRSQSEPSSGEARSSRCSCWSCSAVSRSSSSRNRRRITTTSARRRSSVPRPARRSSCCGRPRDSFRCPRSGPPRSSTRSSRTRSSGCPSTRRCRDPGAGRVHVLHRAREGAARRAAERRVRRHRPEVVPNLPVAIDTAGIERDVAGSWALLPVRGRAGHGRPAACGVTEARPQGEQS